MLLIVLRALAELTVGFIYKKNSWITTFLLPCVSCYIPSNFTRIKNVCFYSLKKHLQLLWLLFILFVSLYESVNKLLSIYSLCPTYREILCQVHRHRVLRFSVSLIWLEHFVECLIVYENLAISSKLFNCNYLSKWVKMKNTRFFFLMNHLFIFIMQLIY